MKDKTFVCYIGHFDDEIALDLLNGNAKKDTLAVRGFIKKKWLKNS